MVEKTDPLELVRLNSIVKLRKNNWWNYVYVQSIKVLQMHSHSLNYLQLHAGEKSISLVDFRAIIYLGTAMSNNLITFSACTLTFNNTNIIILTW